MRRVFFAFVVALFSLSSANGQDIDIVRKCSNKDGTVDPAMIDNLALNLADPVLGKYDDNCNGKLDGDEVTKRERDIDSVFVRKQQMLLAIYAQKKQRPVPTDELKGDLELNDPGTLELPFFVRDAYSAYSILNNPPKRDRAEGARISYTRDVRNSNNLFSASGAVIGKGKLALSSGSDNPLAALGVKRAVIAPAFEFDRQTNKNNPSKEVDYLAGRMFAEFQIEHPHALFRSHYIRYAAHLKSDWSGDSKIWGGYAEWQPMSLPLAIGAYRRIGPVQVRWQPIVRFEADHVADAGRLTDVTTGDNYYRAGPIVQAYMRFFDPPFAALDRLTFEAQYRHLWKVAGDGKDIEYFQSGAAYNLDEAGNYALSFVYRTGQLPGNFTNVKDWKVAFTIKN